MPNYAELLKLMSKLPKGSKAAQELVAAQEAALAAEKAALYAPHTPPTETGKKALKEAKSTLSQKKEKTKEAPSIIIPGKVSNVQQKALESKGEYGAKRVQKAADEIKNLEDQFTEDALRSAFLGDNAIALMIANPAEFKNFAAPLESPYRPAVEKYLWEMQSKKTRSNENIPHLAIPKGEVLWEGGAADVPYLMLDKEEGKLPFVTGHEGRHRNVAMSEMGYPSTLWRMLPRASLREPLPRRSQEEYLEALIKEIGEEPLVIPENRFRDEQKKILDWTQSRKLPKLFTQGGLAMAGGGQFPPQAEIDAEIERKRPRTRAGVPVKDTNVMGGTLQGLGEMLLGAGRGAMATGLGAPADILNMIDLPKLMTGESYQIPYGSEYFLENLPLEPTTHTGKTAQTLGQFLPISPEQPVKAAVKGVKKAGKALAPTLEEMFEAQMKPYQMAIAPEGKAGKVKAPANEIGFYNPAEKAALNLQRKKGAGDAFIADLKKQPGVNDERIAELGLDQLKGKPNVTKEEIIALAEQNRIPLRESVKSERNENLIEDLESRFDEIQEEIYEARSRGDSYALSRLDNEMQDNLSQQKALKSVDGAKFGPIEYPNYNMPGGKNYREIVVRVPNEKQERFLQLEVKKNSGTRMSPAELKEWESLLSTKEGTGGFSSSHFPDDPNPLFHLRVADHTDAEGKTGLLIDELQSDWHQQGREKGYKNNAEKEYNDYFDGLKDRFIEDQKRQYIEAGADPDRAAVQAMNMYVGIFDKQGARGIARVLGEEDKVLEVSDRYKKSLNAVPDAPFKDNWYQLGLKRAIKEAADTGMDRVYLTTGARQADRYDLSKQLNRVSYQDGVLHGYDKEGALVINKHVSPEELPNYVGKDLGKKMVDNAQRDLEIRNQISKAKYEKAPEEEINALRSQLDDVKTDYAGVDLRVGGEGMKQYYDKNYRNYLEKYAKQHGSKLGETDLITPARTSYGERTATEAVSSHPEYMDFLRKELGTDDVISVPEDDFWKAYDKFETYLFGKPKGEKVYYIDITDAMRESAKKGQSYAEGGAVHPAVDKFASSLPHPAVAQFEKKMADGGGAWSSLINGAYNTTPDVADAERTIQGPAYAEGGGVWKQLVKGAANA